MTSPLKIDNTVIEEVEHIKFLGVYIDKHLTESTCFRNIKELFEQSVLQVTGPLANPLFKNLAILTFIVISSRILHVHVPP